MLPFYMSAVDVLRTLYTRHCVACQFVKISWYKTLQNGEHSNYSWLLIRLSTV